MRITELENKLRKHAQIAKSVINVPFEIKEEINNVNKRVITRPKGIIKRTILIAAVLVLCIVTASIVPHANSLKGFFRDIIRFDGAITGTQYENATNEIKVDVLELTSENGNIIPLELTFKNPTEAPFPYIQEIAVADYMMIDSATGEILKIESYPEYLGRGTVKDGKVLVDLSINSAKLKSGKEYTIVIEKMYGLSKADAPLHITGTWKCEFIK